jgi:hypothetical protein
VEPAFITSLMTRLATRSQLFSSPLLGKVKVAAESKLSVLLILSDRASLEYILASFADPQNSNCP